MTPHRLALPLAALFIAGCSGGMSRGTPETIAVQSEPAGASVIVMGQELGSTPLSVSTKTVFPASYATELEGQYGRILLRKAGCGDFVTSVDGKVLSHGLKAKLECTATATPSPVQPAVNEPHPAAPLAAAAPGQRLRQLDDLRKDGLISEEEYQLLRRRVLDTL
jgi:hypothetical protein